MKTISLKAIDVGFDLRDCGMSVDLSREPDRLLVNYDGGIIAGTKQEVALALAAQGFAVITARQEKNGREIRARNGKFESQPPNDNYWKAFSTLAEAVAFAYGPEQCREAGQGPR